MTAERDLGGSLSGGGHGLTEQRERLAGIETNIAAVGVAMTDVANAIRADVRAEMKRNRLAQIPVLVLLTLLFVIGVMNFVILRQINAVADRTNQTAEIIYDCTHVEGDCSQRNARSTAGAVGRINDEIDNTGRLTTEEVIRRLDCIRRTNQDCPTPPPSSSTTIPDANP